MPNYDDTMHEFKSGRLHSGSKTGRIVTNPKQAQAIAIHQKQKADKMPASLAALQHAKGSR